jgi:hypothetical protein
MYVEEEAIRRRGTIRNLSVCGDSECLIARNVYIEEEAIMRRCTTRNLSVCGDSECLIATVSVNTISHIQIQFGAGCTDCRQVNTRARALVAYKPCHT